MENTEKESTLKRLETYDPPPYPVCELLDRECFDYRVKHNAPVPANVIDTFIFDVISNADQCGIRRGEEWFAVRYYRLAGSYEYLSGYRPWTFWNFVHTLGVKELFTLECEVRNLLKSGRDWRTEDYDLKEIPEAYRD